MESQGEPQTPAQGAQQQPAPASTQPGERRLSEAEWRALRRTQLADSDLKDLIGKVVSLESDLFKARNGQLEDGRAVITSDEMRELEAYRALGKPADLKTAVEDGKAAITERDTLKRERDLGDLAGKAGASPTVLRDLLARDGLTAKVQGEGDKAAVHLYDSEGKDLGTVKDYADKTPTWKDYAASLFPTAQGGQQQGTGTVVTPQAGAGTGGNVPAANPITAALSHGRPATGGAVVSAFDFSPRTPTSPTGGSA